MQVDRRVLRIECLEFEVSGLGIRRDHQDGDGELAQAEQPQHLPVRPASVELGISVPQNARIAFTAAARPSCVIRFHTINRFHKMHAWLLPE